MTNDSQWIRQTAAVMLVFGLIACLLPGFALAPTAWEQTKVSGVFVG